MVHKMQQSHSQLDIFDDQNMLIEPVCLLKNIGLFKCSCAYLLRTLKPSNKYQNNLRSQFHGYRLDKHPRCKGEMRSDRYMWYNYPATQEGSTRAHCNCRTACCGCFKAGPNCIITAILRRLVMESAATKQAGWMRMDVRAGPAPTAERQDEDDQTDSDVE